MRNVVKSRHKLLLFTENEIEDGNENEPLFVVNFDGSVSATELKFEQSHGHRVKICYGTCNGLILALDYSSQLVLLNPTTRKSKVLPNPPCCDAVKSKECGIGYDSTSDDYKAVVISDSYAVAVYSLKSDSWKIVRDSPLAHGGPIKYCQPGDICNASPHWFDLIPSSLITSFNFADEEFRVVPLPSEFDRRLVCELSDDGDSLCLICQERGMWHHWDIWVMKEYGVVGSWTKFSFDLATAFIKPVFFLGDEELVLVNEFPQVIVCNGRDNTSREIDIHGLPIGGLYGWYCSFVESLVSLDNTMPSIEVDK